MFHNLLFTLKSVFLVCNTNSQCVLVEIFVSDCYIYWYTWIFFTRLHTYKFSHRQCSFSAWNKYFIDILSYYSRFKYLTCSLFNIFAWQFIKRYIPEKLSNCVDTRTVLIIEIRATQHNPIESHISLPESCY